VAKKRKKKVDIKLFHWFIGWSVITLAVFTTLFIFYQRSQSDTSMTGEETQETTQNVIPDDVQSMLQNTMSVLGATEKSKSKITPTTLHVPILMYHYVEYVQDPNDKPRIALNTTPWTLEQEVKTLADSGYTFMTNAELTQALDGKTKLPQKPIVLTFDDGYRDFYQYAYPILKKYNAKATEYVIAGYPYFNTPNHMTPEMVTQIAQDGLVEIGAHTVHHVWLKGQTLATDTFEISQSKKMLEDLIHRQVVSFAYPFGAFDVQAIQSVKIAGFTTAVSTIPGIDQPQVNRFFLYRLRPGGRVGEDLLSWLTTVRNTN